MANTKQDMNAFLASVYDASKAIGDATGKCVAILKSGNINWKNKTQVDLIGREFKLGRIAQILNLDKVQAGVVQDKTKYNPKVKGGNTDDRRTDTEQKAWNAAKSAWSHVALLAGMPNKRTGQARPGKGKGDKPEATPQATQATQDANALPNVSTAQAVQDVAAFALRVADLMLAFQNRNATVVAKGSGWFSLFADFEAKAKALASEVKAPEPKAKPIKENAKLIK